MNKIFSFLAGAFCGALVGGVATLFLTPALEKISERKQMNAGSRPWMKHAAHVMNAGEN